MTTESRSAATCRTALVRARRAAEVRRSTGVELRRRRGPRLGGNHTTKQAEVIMANISVASVQAALLELAARPEFGKFVSALQLGQLTSTAAVASNPATATAALTVGIAAFCWIGQVTTGYWSFVDRIWVC